MGKLIFSLEELQKQLLWKGTLFLINKELINKEVSYK